MHSCGGRSLLMLAKRQTNLEEEGRRGGESCSKVYFHSVLDHLQVYMGFKVFIINFAFFIT
jgi:hypothetical protein